MYFICVCVCVAVCSEFSFNGFRVPAEQTKIISYIFMRQMLMFISVSKIKKILGLLNVFPNFLDIARFFLNISTHFASSFHPFRSTIYDGHSLLDSYIHMFNCIPWQYVDW